MTTCLVLGGNGFIGSHIVDILVKKGYNVKVFGNFNSGLSNLTTVLDQVELIKGDFRNRMDIKRALKGIDFVFHNIYFTIPQTSVEDPIYDVENVISTLQLLHEIVNSDVKKIIFSSSGGAIYGMPKEVPITESHPTDPISPYGVSKLSIEKYIQNFNNLYGIDYTILRYSNVYGERQDPFGKVGAITIFLNRIKEKKPLVIFGDGSAIKDYVYVKDVANANLLAMENRSKEKVFNVGSGAGISVNHLIDLLFKITGEEIKVEYTKRRTEDVSKMILDISRIEKELRWMPETSFEDGIKNVYEWLKNTY